MEIRQVNDRRNWCKIINNNNVEIKDEEVFLRYIVERGHSQYSTLHDLEMLFDEWKKTSNIIKLTILKNGELEVYKIGNYLNGGKITLISKTIGTYEFTIYDGKKVLKIIKDELCEFIEEC